MTDSPSHIPPPDDAQDATQRIPRPFAGAEADRRPGSRRLDQMDLDPPDGPVPDEVIAHFARAVERQAQRDARGAEAA